MKSRDYKDLIIWQKSMDLTEEIYTLTKMLPSNEEFALTNQIRRAVVSIPSNIAEGHGRMGHKACVNFLSFARGSLFELETQLNICIRLNYLSPLQTEKSERLILEISKMLNGLINYRIGLYNNQSPNNIKNS